MCLQCDLPNFSDSFFDLSTDLCLNNSFSSLDSLSISSPVTPIQFNCTNSKRPTRAPEPKPKRRKLKGMIINCNGLKSTSRFTEFQALLDLHDPDFVLGTSQVIRYFHLIIQSSEMTEIVTEVESSKLLNLTLFVLKNLNLRTIAKSSGPPSS